MVFEGITIDECLKKATDEIGKEKSEIKYKVIGMDKKDGQMFIKIEVLFDESRKNKIDLSDFKDDEIEIEFCDEIDLFVNGSIKKDNTLVKRDDEVFVSLKESNQRKIEFKISSDKLEGTLKITQKGLNYLELTQNKEENKLILGVTEGEEKEINFDKKKEEVLKIIKNENVTFGLDFKVINEMILSREEVVEKVIAKGIDVINDEEDIVELTYKEKEDTTNINYKVDYKNIKKIDNVYKDKELAVVHIGKIGTDGKDILGNIIKKKDKKGLPIALSDGVTLKDNIIYSTKDGRVKLENNILSVVDIMDLTGDIDASSGNINFVGDVNITGNVKMGMNVSGGNLINIDKNVESAIIKSGGDTIIKGSVLNSKVISGVENEDFLKYIDSIKSLIEDVDTVRSISIQLKESGSINMPDGKLIKFVIDHKVHTIQKKIFQVLAYKVAYKSVFDNSEGLIEILRKKLAGLGPLNINDLSELDDILKVLNNEVDKVTKTILRLANIYISYCQDSKISASGDIIFTGKGQYVSEICAGRDVIFEGENAVSRGGVISANRNIKARVVGSPAGVTTLLNVMDKGKIEIDMFYHNTTVKIGNRRCVLDTKGKNLVAYLDKDGELIVEKLSV